MQQIHKQHVIDLWPHYEIQGQHCDLIKIFFHLYDLWQLVWQWCEKPALRCVVSQLSWQACAVNDKNCYLKVKIFWTQHWQFPNSSHRIHHMKNIGTKGVQRRHQIQNIGTKGCCFCEQQNDTCSNYWTIWHHLALSVTSAPTDYSPWSHTS